MGVRILLGFTGGGSQAAGLYDSVTGWMFGPIFEHTGCYGRARAFADWFKTDECFREAARFGFSQEQARQGDARVWSSHELEKLYGRWFDLHVGDDGLLKEAPPAD